MKEWKCEPRIEVEQDKKSPASQYADRQLKIRQDKTDLVKDMLKALGYDSTVHPSFNIESCGVPFDTLIEILNELMNGKSIHLVSRSTL